MSNLKKWAPTEQSERDSVKSLCEKKGKCFGSKMKNKREGQFVKYFFTVKKIHFAVIFVNLFLL